MAGKISVKTILIFLMLYGIDLILCACMNPVDVQAFLEDENVREFFDKTKARVIIHEDSSDYDNLEAGDGVISGLTSGNYYMVEEYEKIEGDMVFKRNLFLKADGTHWGDLGEIGRLEADTVKNLKNFFIYKVISAAPFDDGEYIYFAFGDKAVRKATVTDGAVIVRGPKEYYLNLAPLIDAEKGYEIMKIPNTSADWGSNSRTSAYYTFTGIGNVMDMSGNYVKFDPNRGVGIYQYRDPVKADPPPTKYLNLNLEGMSVLGLPGIDTQSDYIFAEYDNSRVTNFIVLEIERLDDLNINVEVEYSDNTGKSPEVTVEPVTVPDATYSQNNTEITISVTNADQYTSLIWYKDGIITTTTGTSYVFVISTNMNNIQVGDHQIMVVGYMDEVPYSTMIDITITQ